MSESELVASGRLDLPQRTWWYAFICFLLKSGAFALWLLVGTGLLLRLTIQDRWHPWALIYYLTPIPALPLWLLIAGLFWRVGRNPTTAPTRYSWTRVNSILVLLTGLWAIHTEYVQKAGPPLSNDLHFLFWNVARVNFGVEPVAEQLRDWDPVVIGIVEGETYYPKLAAEWEQQLANYTVCKTHFGGLLAIKGTVKSQINHHLLPNSWCDQFDVSIEGSDFTILLVDIAAQLNLSRKQPLQDLAKLAEKLADRPLVIMGDFNTPDDSPLLDRMRKHCQSAIRERGTGYAATWPVPLPVLTLDQVWFNELVSVSSCNYGWSYYSDHRPASVRLSFSTN